MSYARRVNVNNVHFEASKMQDRNIVHKFVRRYVQMLKVSL
jgi:hypothetical protein